MAQKHLQLLRNLTVFTSYTAAYDALILKTSYADGTPILARYTDNEDHQKTLLGVVNNGTVDVINNVADYLLRNYTAFTGDVTTITSADDVKTAIAKLEKHIQDVAADITVTVEEAQDANTQAHLDITAITSTTEGDTYTIGLKDVASASALTQEISDRESGDTALSDRLGTGVTSANTATAQLAALSGNTGSTSAETSVEGAKRYADEKVRATLDGLDASTVSGESKVVIDVTQENGQITATAANLTGVKLDGYSEGSDADIAATDTLGEALGKLQAQINAMDKDADAVAGQVVTTVAEADGKVTETKANVKDLQLGGYSKTNDSGAISGTDTVNVALSKLENNIAAAQSATTVDSSGHTINVTTAASGTNIDVNVKSGEHVIATTGDGLYTDLDFVKIETGLPETIKERYQLLATDDSQIGVNLDIPKDSHIVSINYITTGEHAQNLEYVYIDVSGNTQTTYVDMSELVLETEFASGVTVTDHVAHGVVDTTSEKVVTTYNSDGTSATTSSVLTVGADGFKVSNVQTAIDAKIGTLDVSDTADDNQYVSSVSETDGKITVSRKNLVNGKLSGYTKGSDSTAIATGDTLGQALGKLENQIDAAKAAATTVVREGVDNPHMAITSSTDSSTSATTYTITLTDVASDTALTAEIAARKAVDGQNGQTYAANSSANYINNATSLNDADVKLDAALKAEETARINQISGLNYSDTAVAGQYVTEVDESEGVISVSRANVSEAVLNNYTKGSDATAVSATDTVNEAISKLENQIDAVEGDYLKNVVVNGVTGTAANNVATVDIGGADIKLSGYTNTTTGTPAATDTVNQAISKLYNKGIITSTNSGITVDQSGSATTLTLNVSIATAAASTTGATYAQVDDGNAIELKNDGIFVSSNWDCGTY